MAVEINSSVELQEWLEGQPDIWAQVIAYRCALRVFPLVVDPNSWTETAKRPEMIMTTVRSLVAALAAARISSEKSFVEAASEAAHSGVTTVKNTSSLSEIANFASAAALKSAAAVGGASRFFASEVLEDAIVAMDEGGIDTETTLRRLEGDCGWLSGGVHPTVLFEVAIWNEKPDWFEESWGKAARVLSQPDDGFEIWREWYYGRMEGLPHAFADFNHKADEKFYRWIVQRDDNWWNREPAEVNAEITEFVDALRITAPTDEDLRQNPRAFTFSLDEDGRSELDEETLPNGLQGDADERDNHSEILRLIETALLATAAQTNAKDMEEPTQLLKEAVGESIEDLRPRLFILRAREIIRQVEERESGDSMNPQLSEKQRDAYLPLVDALKMIAEFSPKLAELWHGKLGQTGAPLTREMLDLIAEALRTTGQTTALAQSVIEASNAQVAPDAPEEDPARIAASETSRNAFRKMGGTLKKAGEGAKNAENIISLGERLYQIAGILRDKLPSGEVIARILAIFGGG